MIKPLSVNELKKEVHYLDPKLKESDPAFTTAMILLSSSMVGADARTISKHTGIALSEVSKRSRNFRACKVWDGKKVRHSGWFDKKSGGVAFWLDVCVGDGVLSRK